MIDIGPLRQENAKLKNEKSALQDRIVALESQLTLEKIRNVNDLTGCFQLIVFQFNDIVITGYDHILPQLESTALKIQTLSESQKTVLKMQKERYNSAIVQKMNTFNARWEKHQNNTKQELEDFWTLVDDLFCIVKSFWDDAIELWRILNNKQTFPDNLKDNYNKMAMLYNVMNADFESFYSKFAKLYDQTQYTLPILNTLA